VSIAGAASVRLVAPPMAVATDTRAIAQAMKNVQTFYACSSLASCPNAKLLDYSTPYREQANKQALSCRIHRFDGFGFFIHPVCSFQSIGQCQDSFPPKDSGLRIIRLSNFI
jgi:hypothetical protein